MFKEFLRKKKLLDYTSWELATDILKEWNLSIKEDRDRLYFTYRGIMFSIKPMSKDTLQIYSQEIGINVKDENIHRLKEIMNYLNYKYDSLSSYYIEGKDKNNLLVISKITTVFIPEMPDVKVYLRNLLDKLFDARREIKSILEAKYSSLYIIGDFGDENEIFEKAKESEEISAHLKKRNELVQYAKNLFRTTLSSEGILNALVKQNITEIEAAKILREASDESKTKGVHYGKLIMNGGTILFFIGIVATLMYIDWMLGFYLSIGGIILFIVGLIQYLYNKRSSI